MQDTWQALTARASAWALLAALCSIGCRPTYRLRPTNELSIRDAGMEARVERLEVAHSGGDSPFVPYDTRVVVRVANRSSETRAFDPTKIRIGKRDEKGDVLPTTGGPGGPDLGSPLQGGVAGARVGGQLSGGALGGGLGGAVGAGVGLAGAAVIMLPIAIVLLVKQEIERPPDKFRTGTAATLRLDLGEVSLDDGEAYELLLGEAFGLSPTSVRVPLVRRGQPHGGYARPRKRAYLGVHTGGGPIHLPGSNSGLGGAQLLTGLHIGRFGVGPTFSVIPFPAFSGGVDLNYTASVASGRVSLIPSIGYHAHFVFMRQGFVHGPSAGLDVLFPTPGPRYFDWAISPLDLGFYVKAGPAWHSDGARGLQWQVGLSVR